MPRSARVIHLTIYSRPGCHLCEEMKASVERAVRASGLPTTIDEVDISRDAELESRYGIEIPVLIVDGQKVAKYRVSEWEVRRILTARSGGSRESGESGT
jgi:glutaredoxin